MENWKCSLPNFPTVYSSGPPNKVIWSSTNSKLHNDDVDAVPDDRQLEDGASLAAYTSTKDGKRDQIIISLARPAGNQEISSTDGDNPLSALLSHRRSPVSSFSTDHQRLAWLRSQVIGENQEFVTPFGKRHLLYADHTASGRSLLFVEDFISRHILPFYGNTHTDDSYVGRMTSKMVKVADEYIKKQLGGTSEDVLMMSGWGCTGAIKRLQEVMGVAVPSTLRGRVIDSMFSSSAGDNDERWLVFTGPYEHHSNLLSWRQSLAEVIEVPANKEGLIDTKFLEEKLKSPQYSKRKLKLGSFSATSNVTGIVTNTRMLAYLLHRHGAFACFDFAAGAPHLKIDMKSSHEDGYDAVFLSPHKFPGGPGTPGVLLMTKHLYKLQDHPPSTCGGGTVAYVNGFNEKDTLYHDNIEVREDSGTPPIVGKVRCALAFWVKEMVSPSTIWQRESFFILKAIRRLSAVANVRILGGVPPPHRVPILSFVVHTPSSSINVNECSTSVSEASRQFTGGKPLHGRFIVKLLNDLFGIQARGGCACAGPYGHMLLNVGEELSLAIRSAIQQGYEGLKPGWARLDFGYTMAEEEVEYILCAIEFVAKYGQRLLALYDFDWCSGNWTLNRENALLFLNGSEISKVMIGRRGATGAAANIDNASIMPEVGSSSESRRQRFRRYLRFAKGLAHLLPELPPPRAVPTAIDSRLLLFCI